MTVSIPNHPQLRFLETLLSFEVLAFIVAFLWAPFLIKILYQYNVTRREEYDASLGIEGRKSKAGVPIMGGLLVIITVAIITFLFNWDRRFTYVPVGVMLLASALGGIDDLLNIFGKKRRVRKISQVLRLIRVHKSWAQRIWLFITLPWSVFKRLALWLGSHPGRGTLVHERLVFQFLVGSITAWWVYFKLGEFWQEIHIPFLESNGGYVNIGWLIIPLIIFLVMFAANAVNFADGMDGLAGGSLIITFSALTFLAWVRGAGEIAILNATICGALIAYTYFNIKPARFQMGDVGSLGLGALMAINTIAIREIVLLPLLGFIFTVELLSVVIQLAGRYALGRRIFKMTPIHHHFELMGWTEEKTVMRFWMVHAMMVLFTMWLALQ